MVPRFRAPLEVFLWSRTAIWVTMLLAYVVLEGKYAQILHPARGAPSVPRDASWGFDVWGRWDGGWFIRVAEDGYIDRNSTTAFFPAYPMVVRAVGWLSGGHYLVAGVIVSLAACGAAFVLLYELARDLVGEESARRTLVFLAVFPTAFFLNAVYSESLYLLLTVAAFLAATRGRWWWAGVAAGLAMLTRPTGVMLLPALALLAVKSSQPRRAWPGLALSLPIAAIWPAWLWATFGHPFAFLHAERQAWQRHLSAAGPLGGAWKALEAAWHALEQIFAGGNRFPGTDDATQAAGLNLEALVAAVFVIVLGIVAWRVLGAAYGVFVLASVALPFSSPAENYPLLSMPRFALGVFPVFVALGAITRRPRVIAALVGIFALFLGLDIARWVEWQFVA